MGNVGEVVGMGTGKALAVLAAVGVCVGGCSGDKAAEGAGGSALLPLAVTSPALHENQPIPATYACTDYDHLGSSPPLSWSKGPEGTVAYAVTMVDVTAGNFIHWAVLNIPASTTSLVAGASPGGALPTGVVDLAEDYGKKGYGGPCPPSGKPHYYVFRVTALPAPISASKADSSLLNRLQANALASGTFVVTYQR